MPANGCQSKTYQIQGSCLVQGTTCFSIVLVLVDHKGVVHTAGGRDGRRERRCRRGALCRVRSLYVDVR